MELDDFDLQILQSMQEDNQRTSQEVAQRVNLSPVSCLRRMKRLRESRVVTADVRTPTSRPASASSPQWLVGRETAAAW